MEYSPFNLNIAMEQWGQELAARPGITPENRRELETLLHDAIAEYGECGLNEEESFWLARRRLTPASPSAAEFANTDPAQVWRVRMLWMALACLAFSFWTSLINCLVPNAGLGDIWPVLPARLILIFLIPVVIAVFFAKGKLTKGYSLLNLILGSRRRFLAGATVFILLTRLCQLWQMYHYFSPAHIHQSSQTWINFSSNILWPLALVILVASLLPKSTPVDKLWNTQPSI